VGCLLTTYTAALPRAAACHVPFHHATACLPAAAPAVLLMPACCTPAAAVLLLHMDYTGFLRYHCSALLPFHLPPFYCSSAAPACLHLHLPACLTCPACSAGLCHAITCATATAAAPCLPACGYRAVDACISACTAACHILPCPGLTTLLCTTPLYMPALLHLPATFSAAFTIVLLHTTRICAFYRMLPRLYIPALLYHLPLPGSTPSLLYTAYFLLHAYCLQPPAIYT